MSNLESTGINNKKFRIFVALGICAGCLCVLIGRLWYLQIIQGALFRDRSENNRLRTVYIPAPRGLIKDRFGEELVRNRPAFNIEIITEDAVDVEQTVLTVASIAGADPQEVLARFLQQNKRRRFEPKVVLKDVSRDVVAKVAAQRHRLLGVIINVVPAREYPHGTLASHTIGYTREISGDQLKSANYRGYFSGEIIGQSGIEANLETYLRGDRGVRSVIVNARGVRIGDAHVRKESPGSNVHVTLHSAVQKASERALGDKRGAVVALDAQSGEILAIASSPSYDPSIFTREISKEVWRELSDPLSNRLANRAVQGTFPPGSIFKIFVAAGALVEGVTSTTEKLYCPGFLRFGQRNFRCHKHSGHGASNLYDSIVQSCDVFFYTVGQRLGVDRIHHYAHDVFGLGQKLNVWGLEGSEGLIPSRAWKRDAFRKPADKKWYPGETLPVAIGQGAILTTPLQIARSLAAVVNGGYLLRPRLISKIIAADGRILQDHDTSRVVEQRVEIDSEILDYLRRAMIGVVEDKRGTAHRAALPKSARILVGCKTGTAQVASRESGVKREDHAWFAGFAPADKPRIVTVVLVENGGHGGAVAAPIARDILKAYFGIEGDESA